MPLHLSQHKSYHPYNRVNQERVARDEALAAQQEEQQHQAAFAHRDQARLEALRARRYPGSSTSTSQQVELTSASHTQTTSHSKPQSGHALLRPEDELVPWYTTKQLRNGAEARKSDDQRLEDAYRDSTSKSSNDPLKAMQAFLAQRKAAKDLPQSASSSSNGLEDFGDQYEPEAVRAAKSRRRHRPHTRSSSPPTSSRDSSSRTRRRHRAVEAPSRHHKRHKQGRH